MRVYLFLVMLIGVTLHMSKQVEAEGLDNPVLAYNLNPANDYQPGLQFLDQVRLMRPWSVRDNGDFQAMENPDLRAAGYLDADGWVTSIPEGARQVTSIWVWPGGGVDQDQYTGRYVIRYKGTGRLKLHLGAKEIWRRPGTIVFENTGADTFMLLLQETDPKGVGDYIRDIVIVPEKYEHLYDAGAMFNPEWISIIEDARVLRFMDWMKTNHSEVTSWDQRPIPTGPNQGAGVPVEVMVRLSNEIGADPWFTMPHLADETYLRNFATYVRDHLDKRLKIRVEYSNEVWNGGFAQAKWVRAQAQAEWGEDAGNDYFVKKAVETAQIWHDVFGDEAEARLVHVLAVQTFGTWRTQQLFEPQVWCANEPSSYVDPASVFQELAVTSYFGGQGIGDATFRMDLLERIKRSQSAAISYMTKNLMDPDFAGSIPQVAQVFQTNADIAARHGLKLTLYEGGQHVHQWFPPVEMNEEEYALFQDFLSNFVRSQDMAYLYEELWKAWTQVGDGPFMQFGDIGLISRYGSWGLVSGLNDRTPRASFVNARNQSAQPWWDTMPGDQYLQGVTLSGSRQDDQLTGTPQEDFLIGLAGDDTFTPMGGRDGINGGPGFDRVIVSGNISEYELTPEGVGHKLRGAMDDVYLYQVEEIQFENGDVMPVP